MTFFLMTMWWALGGFVHLYASYQFGSSYGLFQGVVFYALTAPPVLWALIGGNNWIELMLYEHEAKVDTDNVVVIDFTQGEEDEEKDETEKRYTNVA